MRARVHLLRRSRPVRLAALLVGAVLLVGGAGCRPTNVPPPLDQLRSLDPVIPVAFSLVDRIESRRDAEWGVLARLSGVATMPDARVFVADLGSGRILQFAADGRYLGGVDGGGADLRPLDVTGHGLLLFVLDGGARRVLRFTSDGVFRDVFLDLGRLERRGRIDPTALAIDRDGRLAVTDVANHEVLLTGPFLELETTVGEWGSFDGQFVEPRGVAFGHEGVLYVSDRGNRRVQAFDRTGFFLVGSRSVDDTEPDLVAPSGVATDRWGNVYVCDTGAGEVVVFTPDLQVLARVGGGDIEPGSLRRPVDCAIGPDGRLYVTDVGQSAMLVYEVVYP